MKTNISWLFYKDYFDGLNFADLNCESNQGLIEKKNERLLNARFYPIENKLAKQSFGLIVQYPGLVTGVGINHEVNIKGEFKLGVHFDYTTGMPVIYGSSIKGLLRSAFPDDISEIDREPDDVKREKKRRICEGKEKMIRKYLGKEFDAINVQHLRDFIFSGKQWLIHPEKKEESVSLSVYDRDIFYDAVIESPNRAGKILASDSITPHPDPLENPIPLTFLKIAPGVKLRFNFDLKPCRIGNIDISTEIKTNLFCKIIESIGAGAKTNVGYGQLSAMG